MLDGRRNIRWKRVKKGGDGWYMEVMSLSCQGVKSSEASSLQVKYVCVCIIDVGV